jgi:subtilisin family serine protease
MGRRLAISLAVIATLAALLHPTAASARGAERYIVVLKGSVANPRAVAAEHSARFGAQVSHVYRHALKGYAATLSSARLAALRADSRVAFISEDREVRATAQTLPTGVNRIEGDASSTASGDGSGSVNVRVAIIDTGIDLDHPDLNVVGGKNCSKGKSFDDGNGHGTHVAGTVAAKDDSQGVVGVAPGAPLYSVRVLNNAGFGSWASVICGIDWVTANAASIKVANMSLGGSGSDGSCGSDALHQAICNSVNAGVTYVVAAGNSTANFSGFVPAAYDQVLTVTAMADFNGQPGGGAAATCRADGDDTAADFSNFTTAGSADAGHTIAAPGVCINSTWKGGGYNTISGTSMASPHVAGAAALCIAGPCSGMSPSQVRNRLRTDAAAQPASYGFTGVTGRYYGNLVYAGGY